MKKPFLYFVAVVAFLTLTSTYCEGKSKPKKIIQYVPELHVVEISLYGSGKVVFDWGNGIKTRKRLNSTSITMLHNTQGYSGFISVTGKNIELIRFVTTDKYGQKVQYCGIEQRICD